MKNRQLASSELYYYQFCSRNKDNIDVSGFKTRIKTLLAYEEDEPRVLEAYANFVKEGVPHESCRLYKTINPRDEEKIIKALGIKLLTNDQISVTNLVNVASSIACLTENRAGPKWLFDFDEQDENKLQAFINYINNIDSELLNAVYKTPHGFAIITNRGFDTRGLNEVFKDYDFTLMKDNVLFKDIRTTEEPYNSFNTYYPYKELLIEEKEI